MRKQFALIAGFVLAAVLVAGCGPAPGAAATVDGDVIGQDEVAAVISELTEYGVQETTNRVLAILVVAPTIIEIGSAAGGGVSDEQVLTQLEAVGASNGLDAPLQPDLSDATLTFVRAVIMLSGMSGAPTGTELLTDVSEQVAKLDVIMNPRYGEWDPGAWDPNTVLNPAGWDPGTSLTPATYDWIIVPEAEPT